MTQQHPTQLNVATWNIAAVNNNPFEYWITHNDPAYVKFMEDIQNFINNPGNLDKLDNLDKSIKYAQKY